MTLKNLENLVKIGQLNKESFNQKEFKGLITTASQRLSDVLEKDLSYSSRFDLSYNAAHALSLAAMRHKGYRSNNRFQVFQCLPHTLDISKANTRIFILCHERRNLAEYEGHLEEDEQLLTELISATQSLLNEIRQLANEE